VRELFVADRDYIEKGKRAFVSFIRSYKEHDLKFIFVFAKLDLGDVANSFFQNTIPRVKEILGKKIENFKSINLGNIHNIEFEDKNKGK
jgi:ATP-dependent RNA helicase DDX55/SPB4